MSHYWFSYSFPVTDRYKKSVQYRRGGARRRRAGVRGVATGHKAQGNDTEHSPNHAVRKSNQIQPPFSALRRNIGAASLVYTHTAYHKKKAHHITSHHITSHHITSHHITSQSQSQSHHNHNAPPKYYQNPFSESRTRI